MKHDPHLQYVGSFAYMLARKRSASNRWRSFPIRSRRPRPRIISAAAADWSVATQRNASISLFRFRFGRISTADWSVMDAGSTQSVLGQQLSKPRPRPLWVGPYFSLVMGRSQFGFIYGLCVSVDQGLYFTVNLTAVLHFILSFDCVKVMNFLTFGVLSG